VLSAKISWEGGRRRPPPKIPGIPGKLKIRQVCPRKLSQWRGAPHPAVPNFVPTL
jgi:hypothetical protein